MRRPPLRQLAAHAGVSEATVSRVLNSRPGVAEETRRRVLDTLRRLGVDEMPGTSAVPLRTVGIVSGELIKPVYPSLVHHLASELGRRQMVPVVTVADRSQGHEERSAAVLGTRALDGIVFVGGRHTEVDADLSEHARLVERGLPVVLVNGARGGLPVPHIASDEEAGARTAVSHLARLGHTRIGCVLGSPNYVTTHRFVRGYRRALAEAGLDEPADAITDVTFTFEGGGAGATQLISRGVTAVLAANDAMALGALAAAGALGVEIAAVGYDGTDMTERTDPPLTTLRQPFELMARHVADALHAEIHGRPTFRHSFVFEPQLVVRGSTPAMSGRLGGST